MKVTKIMSNDRTPMIASAQSSNLQKEKSRSKKKGSLVGIMKSYSKQISTNKDLITNLTVRRLKISDMKTEYQARAKELGVDKEIIDAKISEYDSEIARLNQQIADLKREDQKRAVQVKVRRDSDEDNSYQREVDTVQEEIQVSSANSSLIKQLASVPNRQEQAQTVVITKKILKVDTILYKRSSAIKGTPAKHTIVSQRVKDLQINIAKLARDLQNNELQKIDSSQMSQPAEEKSYHQQEVKKYKQAAGTSNQEDKTNADSLDVFA